MRASRATLGAVELARTGRIRGALGAGVLGLLLAGCGHAGARTRARVCARGPHLRVLGSGGPIPDDGRASSGVLVSDGERARVLVDAGGGTFLRFAEAGARMADLDVIALTHLHADHSAEVPALLKGAYFDGPRRDLALLGPTGAGLFPDVGAWARAQFGADGGAYAYLSWLLDPHEGPFTLDVIALDHHARTPTVAWSGDGLVLRAVGVGHGPVPALAYRVELAGRVAVFAGDMNGQNDHLAGFARGADVLVMHHAIPEAATGVAARLHARPSEIGRIAAASRVPHLVLSHHMARSLRDLPAALRTIRRVYPGRVSVASDLTCVPLASAARSSGL